MTRAGGAAPAALPTGWRLEVHAALASTSDLLRQRAEAGAAEGLAILAREQTAGRGRSGRVWLSPPGNLYLSILLRPDCPVREAPQWSLLGGVALAEAAAEVVPDPADLRLKWPNDLLRASAKCAGILTETATAPGGSLAWLILGVGVNLAMAPALPERPTTVLGVAESPERFAARLLLRLGYWREVQRAEGFAPVRAAWCRLGPGPRAPIAVRGIAGGGLFAGLAEDGSLLVEIDGARRVVTAGEVLAQGDA